jgi:5'-deoxynucleotidase YfbR-like HD superfamily hydrolase
MHPRIGFCATRGEPKIENPEHVLGHTGGVVLLFMLVKYVPDVTDGLDKLHCLEMAGVHDTLCEWKGGDTNDHHLAKTPEAIEREERKKLRAERAAVREIIEILPVEAGEAFFHLWEEYVVGKTPEGKLVKQLDKLDFVLTMLLYYVHGEADETLFREEYLPKGRGRMKCPYFLRVMDEIERIAFSTKASIGGVDHT